MSSSDEKEAVLYAFAVEPERDRATLERYLRQHPELAGELIDLSAELRLAEASDPATTAIAGRNWEAAWKRFRACKPQLETSCAIADPFERFRGVEFVRLACSLNVSRSFLTAFRDGLVVASSIPDRFIARFAQAAETTAEALREFFGQGQAALLARQFKSEITPAHQGQTTFEELVRTSDLTEEQRQLLLEDLGDDGLDRIKPTKG